MVLTKPTMKLYEVLIKYLLFESTCLRVKKTKEYRDTSVFHQKRLYVFYGIIALKNLTKLRGKHLF